MTRTFRTVVFLFSVPLLLNAKTHLASSAVKVDSVCKITVPGDTILLAPGTWTNQVVTFKGNGTAQAPIVLRAATYGSVTLTGTSRLRMGGTWLVAENLAFSGTFSGSGDIIEFRDGSGTNAADCRLTRTSVTSYNPTDKTKENKWVSLYGQRNRVDHCSFENKTNYGATLVVWLAASPNYHRIDSNYFGVRPNLNDNGGETIRVGTSDWSMYDSFTTVEYNLFDRCNGEIEVISSKSCGNVYRYNVFRSCEGMLTLRHGNRCDVYNNWFFCAFVPNSGGVRIIGEDHRVYNNYIENSDGSSMKTGITLVNGVPDSPLNRYFQVKRAVVVHNTLIGNRYSVHVGAGKDSELSLPPLDCIIANNIVWSTRGTLVTYTDTPLNMTYAGNIFFGSAVGVTLPAGNTVADPKLHFGPDSLWHITAESPAVNAAAGSYPFVTADMEGQPRSGAFDVGADEWSAAPTAVRPVTRDDVGPTAVITGITLPVELTRFTAAATFRGTLLEWETASERNSDSFDVERKGRGAGAWRRAGRIPAAGNSHSPQRYSYIDSGFPAGAVLYRLRSNDRDGTFRYSAEVSVTAGSVPDRLTLGENYPNPFNPSTAIEFTVGRDGPAELSVFTLLGQPVVRLYRGTARKGERYSARFDASGLPSGVYLCRLMTSEGSRTRKMLYTK